MELFQAMKTTLLNQKTELIQSHSSGPVEDVDCPCATPHWHLPLRHALGDAAGKSSHVHITRLFPTLRPLGAGVIFQPACLDVAESCGLERKSNLQLKRYLGLAYGPSQVCVQKKQAGKEGLELKFQGEQQ